MKSLKKIEVKIQGIDIEETEKKDIPIFTVDSEIQKGWLVGLGMAKAWKKALTKEAFVVRMGNEIEVVLFEPKTPYEQGIKEALEWVLEGD